MPCIYWRWQVYESIHNGSSLKTNQVVERTQQQQKIKKFFKKGKKPTQQNQQ